MPYAHQTRGAAPQTDRPPPLTSRERVARLVRVLGVVRAARELKLSRQTTLSLALGAPVQRGSVALAESRLHAAEAFLPSGGGAA